MKRKNKGVLTLEAALVIPIVVLGILITASLMTIVYVYDSVQASINNSANVIASNSYLLGFDKINGELDNGNDDESGQELIDNYNKLMTDLFDFNVEGVLDTNINFREFDVNHLMGILNAAQDKSDSDAIDVALTVANVVLVLAFNDDIDGAEKAETIKDVMSTVVMAVGQFNLQSDLTGEHNSEKVEAALKVKGVSGINFQGTRFEMRSDGGNNKDEIIIMCNYDLQLKNYFFAAPKFHVVQRAVVRPWTGG